MTDQTISVVIPVFNTEKYLYAAIESVLSQSFPPSEIIVVDDGSTDESADVARQFLPDIKIIQQPNRGIGTARNAGIMASTSGYLSFLDADDLWTNEKLKHQIEFLRTHPETDMVFGMVEQFISPELPERNQHQLKEELVKMPGKVAGAMLISKETFTKVGLFNENLQVGEFIDWFSRAKDFGLSHQITGEVVLKRRLHTTNQGITRKQNMTDYTTVLREAIARKRMNKTPNSLL